MRTLYTLALAFLLAGCDSGPGIEGTYVADQSGFEFIFDGDGTVRMIGFFDQAVEFDYEEVADNEIKLVTPEGRVVLTRLENGNFDSPWGEMVRQR